MQIHEKYIILFSEIIYSTIVQVFIHKIHVLFFRWYQTGGFNNKLKYLVQYPMYQFSVLNNHNLWSMYISNCTVFVKLTI